MSAQITEQPTLRKFVKSLTSNMNTTTLKDRLCNLCNQRVIEDEMDFLCTCPMYANRRHAVYHSTNESNPDFERISIDQMFAYLIQIEWKTVFQFLEYAFDERKRMLYNVA